MSLMIIKRGILEAFRGVVSKKVTTAEEFLEEIEKRFAKNDKKNKYAFSELDFNEI